ncbi:MAG: hypothetical protein ABS909_01985 [Arthrobacter sp.]
MHTTDITSAEKLVRALFGAHTDAADLIPEDFAVDIPRLGRMEGRQAFERGLRSWRERYPYDLVAVEVRNVITTDEGEVSEFRLQLREGDREFTLPVAVVVSGDNGAQLLRMYHSERLIHGERRGRRAVWPAQEGQNPTGLDEYHPAISSYMTAIASGDAGNVTARLAEGAALDNGVRPVSDAEELRAIFTAMVRTGGARLVRRNEFDDGRTVALEYTSLPRPGVAAGAPRTPPGGGIGIYDYDGGHLIRAIRMYDDFDPDMLIAAGRTAQN